MSKTYLLVNRVTPPIIPTVIPAGYIRVFTEDFDTVATLGSFKTLYGSRFGTYDGATATNKTTLYDSTKVVSVHNSSVWWNMHTESGNSYAATLVPLAVGAPPNSTQWFPITYGQVGVCVRLASHVDDPVKGNGYKIAFLLWPITGLWTNEVDFPEVDPDFAADIRAASLSDPAQRSGTHNFSGNYTTGVKLTDSAYHVCLLDWPKPIAVTISSTTDIVTFATSHGFTVGNTIQFINVSAAAPLATDTTYYVKTVPTGTSVTLSLTNGGTAINFTTNGSADAAMPMSAYIDNVLVYTWHSEVSIPKQPMYFALQAEGQINPAGIPANTYIVPTASSAVLEVPWVYINAGVTAPVTVLAPVLLGMYDGSGGGGGPAADAVTYFGLPNQPLQHVFLDRTQSWPSGMASSYYVNNCAGAGKAFISVPILVGAQPVPHLSSTLSTAAPITSLPISALPAIVTATGTFSSGVAIPTGTPLVFIQAGTTQKFVTTANCSVGATSIAVASQTPNYAYTSIAHIYPAGVVISPNATNGVTATPTLMTLSQVAAGTWDAAFTTVLNTIKNVRPDAILRPGWEPDGDVTFGFPWCGPECGPSYKLAFEHFSALAKSISSTFQIDYNGIGTTKGYSPYLTDCPNLSSFDFGGKDIYENQAGGPSGSSGWSIIASQLAAPVAWAKANGKPYSMPEFGFWAVANGGSGDDPTWLQAAYSWMRTNESALGIICWYNNTASSITSLQQCTNSAPVFQSTFGTWAQALAGVVAPTSITLRSTGKSSTTGTAATCVVNKPPGLAVGDVMIAFINFRTTTTFIAAPAGWTQIVQLAQSTTLEAAMFYKVAVSADVSASTFTFTGTAGIGNTGAITAYTGVNTTSPIGASFVTPHGSQTLASVSAITPAVTNSMIIYGVASAGSATDTCSGYTTLVSPPTFVQEFAQIGPACQVFMADGLRAAVTSTGTGSANLSVAHSNLAFLVALTPA